MVDRESNNGNTETPPVLSAPNRESNNGNTETPPVLSAPIGADETRQFLLQEYLKLWDVERDKSKQMAQQWMFFASVIGAIYGFHFTYGRPEVVLVIPFFMLAWITFLLWTSLFAQQARRLLAHLETQLVHPNDHSPPLWFSDVRRILIHPEGEWRPNTPLAWTFGAIVLFFMAGIYIGTLIYCINIIDNLSAHKGATWSELAHYYLALIAGITIIEGFAYGILTSKLKTLDFTRQDWRTIYRGCRN